jgi:2-oxo-4-hydroxy-4-carboxy-5-ureidoimidazoline decarboxylase
LSLERINAWTDDEARARFLRCCGSASWAEAMTALRPFADEAALFDAADRIWRGLSRSGWLEAFAAHPKIGDLDALRVKFAGHAPSTWAAREQSGVAGAPEVVLRALAEGNRRYEEKFGYIFIICATGKTAGEMLAHLERRLDNDPDVEAAIAAAEQAEITRLRLEIIDS